MKEYLLIDGKDVGDGIGTLGSAGGPVRFNPVDEPADTALMNPIARLQSRLTQPEAAFLCIDPSTTERIELPEGLSSHRARMVEPEHPLDLFDTDQHPGVIAAWLTALDAGYGAVDVTTLDGERRRLELVDAQVELGCVLGVLSAAVAGDDGIPGAAAELPARRYTMTLDTSGRVLTVDEGHQPMMGWPDAEVVGYRSLERVHPDDRRRVISVFGELLRRGPGGRTRVRQRVMTADGETRWIEVTHTNHLDAESPHVFSEAIDVSDEMAMHEELAVREALLSQLTEALPIAVLHLDLDLQPILWNDRWRGMTGCDPATGLDGLQRVVASPDEVARAVCTVTDGHGAEVAVSFPAGTASSRSGAAGPTGPARVGPAQAPTDRHGILRLRSLGGPTPVGYLASLEDVTELVAARIEVEQSLRTDRLTGVMSRLGIEEHIKAMLHRSDRVTEPFALLYLDLNGFKAVNDTRGHGHGDLVLASVAAAIETVLRPEDRLGRIGGDEFVAVLAGVGDRGEAGTVRERIRETLAVAVGPDGGSLGVGAAVGVAVAEPEDDFDALVRRADDAMYRDKQGTDRAQAATVGSTVPDPATATVHR